MARLTRQEFVSRAADRTLRLALLTPWLPMEARRRILARRGVEIASSAQVGWGLRLRGNRLKIGERVVIGSGVTIDCESWVYIHDGVDVPPNTHISSRCDHADHVFWSNLSVDQLGTGRILATARAEAGLDHD